MFFFFFLVFNTASLVHSTCYFPVRFFFYCFHFTQLFLLLVHIVASIFVKFLEKIGPRSRFFMPISQVLVKSSKTLFRGVRTPLR